MLKRKAEIMTVTRNIPKILLTFTFIALLCAGCTTTVERDFAISGSNKSAGIIELSVEQNRNEEILFEIEQPQRLAQERCQLWGYQQTILVQDAQTECISSRDGKCWRSRITLKYQCK